MALQMKSFDQRDWMTFAGAEKFADGSEPKIGTIKITNDLGKSIDAELIYDAAGLHIASEDDEQTYFSKSKDPLDISRTSTLIFSFFNVKLT